MRRSGREEQTTHLTPPASRLVGGDEWLQATLQGWRGQGDPGATTATPEASDATSSTHEIGQEASVCPQIGFYIGFHRVLTNLKPPALQGLRSQILATRAPPALLRTHLQPHLPPTYNYVIHRRTVLPSMYVL